MKRSGSSARDIWRTVARYVILPSRANSLVLAIAVLAAVSFQPLTPAQAAALWSESSHPVCAAVRRPPRVLFPPPPARPAGGALERDLPPRGHHNLAGCSASRRRPSISTAVQKRNLVRGTLADAQAGFFEGFDRGREAQSAYANVKDFFKRWTPGHHAGLFGFGQLPRRQRNLA